MESADIHIWLGNIPDNFCCCSKRCALPPSQKQPRKRQSPYQQPSPPASVNTQHTKMPSTPRTKKRKIGDLVDPHQTPKASESGMSSRISVTSSTSLPPSESGTIRSGSISPRRQFAGLRLDESGIECRQLDTESPPAVAADLVQALCEIDVGMGILPMVMENEIRDTLRQQGQNVRLWSRAFSGSELDELPGHVPSWDQVTTIRDRAMCCYSEGHEEASWNSEVHHRLLEATFRGRKAEPDDPFDFMTCTTARPHRNFVPKSSTSKMIDFCLYYGSVSADEARKLALETCTASVNHTDYMPLQLRPIILSIETKRPGKDLDVAQLQIGVWQSAQWKFLRHVVEAQLDSTIEDSETRETCTREALKELGFIPGVIVQGHRWLFVFSTLEANTLLDGEQESTVYRTLLWTELEFGSTQNHLKTYQIVAGLRRLAGWARDVYVPWHRKYVLAVTDAE